MSDDMFFVANARALRRGRRVAKRTETCRPCVLWRRDAPETRYHGVAMDVSPHGMRVRMMDALPRGETVMVQMMRDEDFEVPLTEPIEASVTRIEPDSEGFIDHGLRIVHKEIARIEPRRAPPAKAKPQPLRASRMRTLDTILGNRRRGRAGR